MILFRDGCAYRARALNWLREYGGRPSPEVMEFGTLDGILGCVAVGLGCTLIPRWIVHRSLYAEQLGVTKLPARIAHVPTVMIHHRDMPALAALNTLRDSIVECDVDINGIGLD
ncbi:LysR substrate-binding domain-containing protein [Candidatus Thiosymbion oneisti]|uniref:LysR substrate-binding domain-containing protein n=1 Tax=Candidatus Thiosymbion oneisti TaxID=589554 RepID=UPI001A9C7FEE|nr:LysR substrate-binding domain-containing protein [Candidatus Thiosymbion oneisti]